MSDLRLAEEERKNSADALAGSDRSSPGLLKAPARQGCSKPGCSLEAQIRVASEALGKLQQSREAPTTAATLMDASVIGIKDELSLVVVNIGSRAGSENRNAVSSASRRSASIGTVRVVDVRERIAGRCDRRSEL